MAGKVFISCGQRPPDETAIAHQIRDLLKSKFDLDSYLAFKVQSFDDVMQITNELSSCDYYLFIDFGREKLGWFGQRRGSLFTHQELAIARHLGFSEIIALQQKGVLLEGFAKYILSNPEYFLDKEDLLVKVENLVRDRGWKKSYSRNLIIKDVVRNQPISYRDRQMSSSRTEVIWHGHVVNQRNDIAAANTSVILKHIEDAQGRITRPDTTFLKWAFHDSTYSKTIFPEQDAFFDLLAIDAGNPLNVYLHSLLDSVVVTPTFAGRPPIISGPAGSYRLTYQLFGENFPILEFTVILTLTGNISTTAVSYA